MNPEDYSRNDLPLLAVSPLIVLGALLLAALLWWGTWALRKRFPPAQWPLAVVGLALISGAFWLFFQLLAHWFALATSWSLIFLALLAGFAWEMILWIYGFEKSLVTKNRGRWLTLLRLLALVTLILILLQPVRSFLIDREINREIAVLLDDSESMLLSDQRLTFSEILDRAQLFGHSATLQKRPPLRAVRLVVEKMKAAVSFEDDALASAPTAQAGLESRAENLPGIFNQLGQDRADLEKLIADCISQSPGGQDRDLLNEYRSRVSSALAVSLKSAENAVAASDPALYIAGLREAGGELDRIRESIENLTQRVDQAVLGSLTDDQRQEINSLSRRTRKEIAIEAAERVTGFADRSPTKTPTDANARSEETNQQSLIGKLSKKYNLRFYQFNRDIEEISSLSQSQVDETPAKSLRAQTDLTGAIEHVLENSSPETLAGILLLSDGRHNAAALPEDSLRQLAIQNSPLCAVPVGGQIGPVDISILDVKAPESIYLDDRVVIKAIAKMDGLLGKRVRARLLNKGQTVDEQFIQVTDINFRSEIRFVHTPKDKGINDYQVELETDPQELFKNNNTWDFKVAVTDDRTNVLLVDGHPRWEFRYLRNLFYGRDKSVHLQYVLLNPDTISGMRRPPSIAASATRKFGDAEATELPRSSDEWQMFDVIIIGDIAPKDMSNSDWRAIEEAVTKRGASLVCVAGPRHMPHGFNNEVLQNLLPVVYIEGTNPKFKSPEESYQVRLTSIGKDHPVTSQSTSRALNSEIWAEFPSLQWRWKSDDIKEGAEILAYAESNASNGLPGADANLTTSPDSIEAALEKLTRQKGLEEENALITTMRAGLGKVVMMNFDQTWRFRYGVGDTYHHRFWGQLTRWGAGPNLRSGNERARLGTDRLTYTPSDSMTVTAKLLDESRKPINDASVYANLIKDGKRVSRQKLSYRSDSSGLYETIFSGFPGGEGEYRIELQGNAVSDALQNDPLLEKIDTELLVVTTRNPVELAELTADRDFLNRAARQTNGRVVELWDLDSLVGSFGSPKETLRERKDQRLWDKWYLMVAFFGLLTTEWVLRRKGGLV